VDDCAFAAYGDIGVWRGKSGAYGFQVRAGAFVARIEGSYTGVMGLPVHETWTLLRRFAAA
jgi:septum formation protein